MVHQQQAHLEQQQAQLMRSQQQCSTAFRVIQHPSSSSRHSMA
jgi:hypothetical protein